MAGLACASGQIRQPDPARNPGAKPLRVYRTWTTFFHPRFGFELPVPPGVSARGVPEEENQPQFRSADQSFVMSAWGGIVSGPSSKVIALQWSLAQQKADRKITYQRRGGTWFVVSGTDARGIEFYEKFTMRGQQVGFLEITFPQARIRQYESWVERIEDGFRLVTLRDGPPELAQQPSRSRARVSAEPQRSDALAQTAPAPKSEPKPTQPPPVKRSAPIPDSLPYAEKIAGKPGYVYSPFSDDHRLVDVSGVPSGTKVKCPYTMKIFRVP